MAMRLLPKSELDKKKAQEQRIEVEEGVKLARRVDNLREVIAEEEAKRIKYRDTQLELIANEIKAASSRLISIEQEVSKAEERRQAALKPLDEEWASVTASKEAVEAQAREVNQRAQAVTGAQNAANEARDEAQRLLSDARIKDAFSNTRFQESENKHQAARDALSGAQAIERRAKNLAAAQEVDIIHRVQLVAQREKRATIKETELAAEKKRLSELSLHLRDREQMLERDIMRTKK